MIIKIDASREFYPALLDEFKNNPQAIPDMAMKHKVVIETDNKSIEITVSVEKGK